MQSKPPSSTTNYEMAFVAPLHLCSTASFASGPAISSLRARRRSPPLAPSRFGIARAPATCCASDNGKSRESESDSDRDSENEVTGDGSSSDVVFPTLYDAWFKPGLQLSEQARDAVVRAYAAGVRDMELQWPVVPNVEEISAGTLLNFEFGRQAADDLGMRDDGQYQLIKRYLASFCNVWWAIELSKAPVFAGRTIWVLSTDGVSRSAVQAPDNVKFASLRAPPAAGDMRSDDVVVVLDPRFNEVWKKAATLKAKGDDAVLIFLNSQFNETYGLTGPRFGKLRDVTPVYFLKRVTRGYVFYSYAGQWRACMERPDMTIEEVERFEQMPKLRDVSNAVRVVSNARYGGLNNDRYVRGFGGRL